MEAKERKEATAAGVIIYMNLYLGVSNDHLSQYTQMRHGTAMC